MAVVLVETGMVWKPGFQYGTTPGLFWFFVWYPQITFLGALITGWLTFGWLVISFYLTQHTERKGWRVTFALGIALIIAASIFILGLFSFILVVFLSLPVVAGLIILIAVSLFWLVLTRLRSNPLVGAMLLTGFAMLLCTGAIVPALFDNLHYEDKVSVGKDTYYLADHRLRTASYIIFRCEQSGSICQRIFATEEGYYLPDPHLSYDKVANRLLVMDGKVIRFNYQL